MSRKFTPPPTKFGPGKPAQPKTPAAPPAATPTHGKHAPPAAGSHPPGRTGQHATAQMKPAGCGCGGNRARPSVIQASTIGERVRSKHFIEKAPRENMRNVTKAKEELKEMQIEEDEKPKRRRNANAEVFCDGECHCYGIPIARANAWYNDVNNLEWLCHVCHGNKLNQQNLAIPPTVLGPCPAGECQGDGCNADHCL